jgi:hypothetical protein
LIYAVQDKVERLVVDGKSSEMYMNVKLIMIGVEDTYDYYSSRSIVYLNARKLNSTYPALWSNNLLDTDAALQHFIDECVNAGPKACALHEKDPHAIDTRITATLERLKRQPLAVTHMKNESEVLDYGIVDYSLVRRLMFAFLYRPYSAGPLNGTALATALAAAERGDGWPFWELQRSREVRLPCDCSTGSRPPRVADGAEMGLAVACSDGEEVNDSLEELKDHFEMVGKTSKFVDMWTHRVRCS